MIRARLLALLVTLVLTLPAASASTIPERPVPPMPDDLLALGDTWLRVDGDLLREHEDAEWWGSVKESLVRAEAYRDAGRFRSMMNAHQSARVSIAYYSLSDELQEMDSVDQKRSRVLAFGDTEVQRSRDAFSAYRAELAALDGELTSLGALEAAFYSAEIAMGGIRSLDSYSVYRREVANAEAAPEPGLVAGLVDATIGTRLTFQRAADVLDVAQAREGVRPVANLTAFEGFAAQIAAMPEDEAPQPHMEALVRLMQSAGANDESVLLVAAWAASVRAEAVVSEQFKFADAAGRGVDAVDDLRENLNATMELPVLTTWTDRGYDGLAARDALDVAWATKDGTRQDVATYVNAWIGVVHSNFTGGTFSAWSTVEPPEREVAGHGEEKPRLLPAPGALIVLAGVAGVAAALRRRDAA